MKSSKKPKEKAEQAVVQGSISKSSISGKKSSKSSGGRQSKLGVGKDVLSIPCGVRSQHGDCNASIGSSLGLVNQMPSKDEKVLRSSSKIKLQLFPIDEKIRIGLEKDGHNPFLELTLSARKKISSVINHLFNKWGSSCVAMGELTLFPFNTAAENVTTCRKWTLSDIGINAGDVHAVLGRPDIFRLRYGWVSSQTNASPSRCTEPGYVKKRCRFVEGTFSTKNEADWKNKELEKCNEILPLKIWKHMEVEQIVPSEPSDQVEVAHKNQDEVKSEGLQPSMSSKIENDTAVEDKSLAESFKYQEPKVDTGISMTSLLWSDLSNISIGGLLSEASMQGRFNNENTKSSSIRLISQSNASDSLDACMEQFKYPQASTTLSPDMPSSILDAESTCHSFAFSKGLSSSKNISTIGKGAFSALSDQNAASESFKCPKSEVNEQNGVLGSNNVQEPKTDSLPCSLGVYNNENSLGLSSIRWNDSLGPFDLPLTSRQTIKDDSISIGRFVR
ncbi:hypothetical protein BVRB_6g133550 [Beta vulgaris subsp. vulgaris]|uniref:TSL-kinase interacting protein 1 n=1 Tax=Beta vulgaris subsp. vulgaris TaxID=3555 RepID=UPI0005402C10|nr:TSL-kinase interacting protein 1 [Beta vulgaris subsp. vulgaris]KMT09256.1 hypothetical protein BVRB_6g133550 [Beta vulgaris subsp. vulgaris]